MPFFVTYWLNSYGLNYRTDRYDWQENFKGTTWGNKKNVINSIKYAIS